MARKPKPWYRKGEKAWYVTLRGKQINLGGEKKQAERLFHELMAQRDPTVIRSDSAVVIIDLFLDWTKKHRPDSFDWYLKFLQPFCQAIGNLCLDELKPYHVDDWLDTHPQWKGTRRCAVTAIKRAFNWAVKQGHIDRNPIRNLEKPPANKREEIITDKEHEKILTLTRDHNFRDVIRFAIEAGPRPFELTRIDTRHLDLSYQRIVFPEKESKGKRKSGSSISMTKPWRSSSGTCDSPVPSFAILLESDGRPMRSTVDSRR